MLKSTKELKELVNANMVALDELAFRLSTLETYLQVEWDTENQEYKKLSAKNLEQKIKKTKQTKKTTKKEKK